MRRLVPYALGLGALALGFALICGLGALWGLLFTALDPTHPEKFTVGINFLRGLACTAGVGMIVFMLGWAARSIGHEIIWKWDCYRNK